MPYFVCNNDYCEHGQFCHKVMEICQYCSHYMGWCFTESHVSNCTAICKESLREQMNKELREQGCPSLPGVLNAVHNGTIGNSSYGQTVKYTCMEEYTLHGNESLTCGDYGNWLGSLPVCVPIGGSDIPDYVFWPVVALLMILLIVALNKECIIKECKRIRRKPQNNRVPNARVGEAGLGLLPQQVPGQQPGSQLIQQPVGPPRAPQAAQPAARMTTELHPADGDQTTGHGGKRQADSVPTGGGGDNEQTKAMTVYEPSNDQNRSWNGSTAGMGNSSMSSGFPYMIQETTLPNAHLGDKQHGWEQSEGAMSNGHCGMQNGHVHSMEPDYHGHDTEAHGRKIALGNN